MRVASDGTPGFADTDCQQTLLERFLLIPEVSTATWSWAQELTPNSFMSLCSTDACSPAIFRGTQHGVPPKEFLYTRLLFGSMLTCREVTSELDTLAGSSGRGSRSHQHLASREECRACKEYGEKQVLAWGIFQIWTFWDPVLPCAAEPKRALTFDKPSQSCSMVMAELGFKMPKKNKRVPCLIGPYVNRHRMPRSSGCSPLEALHFWECRTREDATCSFG